MAYDTEEDVLRDDLFPGENPISYDTEADYLIESEICNHVRLSYEYASGQMVEKLKDYERYWAMYAARYAPTTKDQSPFVKTNVPKLAKIADAVVANLSALTVSDAQTLDFYRFSPEDMVPDQAEARQQIEQYCQYVEYAIRADMQNSKWVNTYYRQLLDLVVTGNMFALMTWEKKDKFVRRKVPNPEYNEAAPYVMKPDGTMVAQEPYTIKRVPVCEYDAPKARYLNPMNVFPSELDKNEVAECEFVCIYDTCYVDDLKRDRVQVMPDGSLEGFYANTDKLGSAEESESTREVDQSTEEFRRKDPATSNTVRKARRCTFIGKLVPETMVKDREVPPAVWDAFHRKFNVDLEKVKGWNTWIVEMINDKYIVRCQPLPYAEDAIPIVQAKFFRENNRTLGHGIYARCEYDERIYNYFMRAAIELTQRSAHPMWGLVKQYFDQTWWMEQGAQLNYSPDKIIPLMPGARLNDAIQRQDVNIAPLQTCYQMMADRTQTMAEVTNMPAVKQGVVSGGATATEISKLGASADVIVDNVAQRIESEFLHPMLEWWFKLRNQYTDEPHLVSVFDDSGQIQQFNVPPEAWLGMYRVNIIGYRQTGNLAVRAMNFKEYASLILSTGMGNVPELVNEYGKILQVRNAERLITQPPPPQPEPPKASLSFAVPLEALPAQVQWKALGFGGLELDQTDLAEMQRLQMVNEVQDQMRSQAKAGIAPSPGMGGPPQLPEPPPLTPPQPTNAQPFPQLPFPTMQPGGGGGGGIEPRQRGVHDEVGVTASVAQKTRNPAGSRRATA